jgi:hypothetical protein
VGPPSIAVGANGFLVAFAAELGDGAGFDIYGIGVVDDVGPARLHFVSHQEGDQQEPTVAYNRGFIIAWQDRRNDPGGEIYGTRMKDDFTLVDSGGFLIASATPRDEVPSLGTGTTERGPFTASWLATPSGKGTGVLACGIDHPAPK